MTGGALELTRALADGATLLETTPTNPTSNLEDVLKTRLAAFYDRTGVEDRSIHLRDLSSRDDIELLTAREALAVIQKVQKILDSEPVDESQGPPPLGTRDLAKLRTLLSIVFKWGVELLYARVSRAWPESTMDISKHPKIVDLTSNIDDSRILSDLTTSLVALVFPEGVQGRISQTLITTSILARHVSDILLPSIALGWLPESLSSSSLPVLHDLRPLVMRLMRLLSPAQTISSLGGIVSSTSPSPAPHVRRACTSLLTKQVLRPDGVQGLCTAMFTEEETNGDEARIDKIEQVARTLNSVPSNMKPQEYYRTIYPRVLHVLTTNSPTSHKRAAAFTIYRSLISEKASQHPSDASSTALALLHGPFLNLNDSAEKSSSDRHTPSPRDALMSIITLIANTEPSPTFISKLLSPLVPVLYSLLYDVSQYKAADPQVKESVLGLLKSWGKIVDQPEGVQSLWSIVEDGKDWQWEFDIEGNFWKIAKVQGAATPSLLMPQDSAASETDASDIDENLFNLYPDPVHFIETVKLFDRSDIASSLFVRLLEDYRDKKDSSNEDAMKTLQKLQIIMQMQKRLSEGTTSNILRKPDQLLSFIYHVLESSKPASADPRPRGDDVDEGDSDDEAPDSEVLGPDDDLIETTITLLLSVLEADASLSARTYPIFNDIFSLLEPLSLKGTSALRPLAREARMVMTARLAETSGSHKPKNEGEIDAQVIYQRALKLLQDPILPVRAHGLLLLRELLGPSYSKDQVSKALIPSILSIFLQSIQDEDSYIFLNAVQGLALLVDRFGKEILQGLVRDYTGKLDGLAAGNLTQSDVDVRLRIGEALSSVIKRCGSALGIYVDLLVPPIYAVVRNSNLPTTLRTSSISLLADCVDTYPLGILPYAEDLCQGLVDLLQVETVPINPGKKSTKETETSREDHPPSPPPSMDNEPTINDSKFPPLRRAALHFLSLFIRASTRLLYDDTSADFTKIFPRSTMQRTRVTLGYISSTDEDNIARVMAREAKENLEQLEQAILGL